MTPSPRMRPPSPESCSRLSKKQTVHVRGRTMEEGATLAGGGAPACVCPYRLPSTVPDPMRPTVCIRRRTTSNGYVAAQPIEKRKKEGSIQYSRCATSRECSWPQPSSLWQKWSQAGT
jgi:hypothetical protein